MNPTCALLFATAGELLDLAISDVDHQKCGLTPSDNHCHRERDCRNQQPKPSSVVECAVVISKHIFSPEHQRGIQKAEGKAHSENIDQCSQHAIARLRPKAIENFRRCQRGSNGKRVLRIHTRSRAFSTSGTLHDFFPFLRVEVEKESAVIARVRSGHSGFHLPTAFRAVTAIRFAA